MFIAQAVSLFITTTESAIVLSYMKPGVLASKTIVWENFDSRLAAKAVANRASWFI